MKAANPSQSRGVNRPSLIVSLHDVTASTLDRVREQVRILSEWGIPRTSLLVVPYYHERERIDEGKAVIDWLKECNSVGHEIVLHGWLHHITAPKNPSASRSGRSWFYENLYTAGEAEFLSLDFEEAQNRISQGLQVLRRLGFSPCGFVAPAWLMNSAVESAAKSHGLLYTNTISELIDFSRNQRLGTRSCVWSTRAGWRRVCSLGWNAFLFQQLRSADPLRISLHPCDLEYPAIWSQIRRLIRTALRTRQPTTYADWIRSRT